MIEGSYRSWDLYTTGQLVDGLQKKKKKKKEYWFLLNGNEIMSSFLGREFYRSILYMYSPEDRGSIPDRGVLKTQKMVLDAALLNSQHYKVWIKGKVE